MAPMRSYPESADLRKTADVLIEIKKFEAIARLIVNDFASPNEQEMLLCLADLQEAIPPLEYKITELLNFMLDKVRERELAYASSVIKDSE